MFGFDLFVDRLGRLLGLGLGGRSSGTRGRWCCGIFGSTGNALLGRERVCGLLGLLLAGSWLRSGRGSSTGRGGAVGGTDRGLVS